MKIENCPNEAINNLMCNAVLHSVGALKGVITELLSNLPDDPDVMCKAVDSVMAAVIVRYVQERTKEFPFADKVSFVLEYFEDVRKIAIIEVSKVDD